MKKSPYLIRILGILLIVIFTGYCGTGPDTRDADIVIFHLNDIHGELDHFARIAGILQREREKNPHVLFMDAGDNFSGNPFVDLYEPKGEPILELLNRLKCDVQVLGNHEFDYGQEILKSYMERVVFPVICANVEAQQAILPQPKPYVILETGGIKIAVLGLIQVNRHSRLPATMPARLTGLRFSDPLETALEYRHLNKDNHIFVALSHLGLSTDHKLAEKMGELDLIIGGHSHTLIEEPTVTNGVLIVQAGGHSDYLGRLDLKVRDGRLVEKKASLIDLKTVSSEDPQVKELVGGFLKNPVLQKEITRLSVPLKGSTELGNLITDAVRRTLDLDVVFHNSGGIRVDELKGSIRYKEIYAMHPFGNVVVAIDMTPAEIRGFIEYDFKRHREIDVQVSGIEVTVECTEDRQLKAVEIRKEGGGLLEEGKTYRVGMNDYMVSAYKFPHLDPGTSTETKIVDIVIQYLKNGVDASRYKGLARTHEKVVGEN